MQFRKKLRYSRINLQEKEERSKQEEQQRLQRLQEQEEAERILAEQRRREQEAEKRKEVEQRAQQQAAAEAMKAKHQMLMSQVKLQTQANILLHTPYYSFNILDKIWEQTSWSNHLCFGQ